MSHILCTTTLRRSYYLYTGSVADLTVVYSGKPNRRSNKLSRIRHRVRLAGVIIFSRRRCCSQRSGAVGDLGQRRLGNERGPAAPSQRRRDQAGVIAVHSRSRGRGRRRVFHFAPFLVGLGPRSWVRTVTTWPNAVLNTLYKYIYLWFSLVFRSKLARSGNLQVFETRSLHEFSKKNKKKYRSNIFIFQTMNDVYTAFVERMRGWRKLVVPRRDRLSAAGPLLSLRSTRMIRNENSLITI